MQTIITLYLIQFIVGVIAWKRTRIFGLGDAIVFSALVLPNILLLSIFFVGEVKDESGIECTGNDDNGCYLNSCGHGCNCKGIKK